jgi:hypothetical protein
LANSEEGKGKLYSLSIMSVVDSIESCTESTIIKSKEVEKV